MRSKLFVPASRPELFDKALAGPADAVSFDLEDAVEASRKPEARETLAAYLARLGPGHGKLTVLRVNAASTPWFDDDLAAAAQGGIDIVNLPKVEGADQVRAAASRLETLERRASAPRRIGLLANIETPRGLRLAAEIAMAHPRVMGLQIGFGDLFGGMGVAQGETAAKQQVRFAVRLAAAEAGLPAWDGAFVDIADPDGFRAEAQAARRLGFAGKSCIHPSQVALANDSFRPSDEEIAHAARVVASARDATARGVGAFVVDGRLVDGPFITLAEHTLALARRLGLHA